MKPKTMADNDISLDYNSDDDINIKKHSRLLDEVLQLDKRQYVKKVSRTEATNHVSEFNLVKPTSGVNRRSTVSIGDLTKVLKGKSKHIEIGKKVKQTQTKANTLRKPVEKPQAERIRRTVGFEKTKQDLSKWNAIVEKNRVASQLTFPLNQGEVHFVHGGGKQKKRTNVFDLRIKSELEKELEKLEPIVETVEIEEKFPLSMDELVERRKEMAKLRAHQSYQEAKAYKRNKIKSKTFHRIQRKERVKQQIKEFEILQKTDPEEALRKLEQIEKTRAEERMSLRHKSTGQWAKNKQIRAKYDKESRQALAQQLTISRDLTQKVQADDSSDSETENAQPKSTQDDSNPWVSTATKSTEFGEFVSGYRKFWTDKNQLESESKTEEKTKTTIPKEKKKTKVADKKTKTQSVQPESKNAEKVKPTTIAKKNKIKVEKNKSEKPAIKKLVTKSVATKKPKPVLEKVVHCNNSWTIEDLFEEYEEKTRKKATEKLNKISSKQTKKATKRKQSEDAPDETIAKLPREKPLRPELDEEIGVDITEDEITTRPTTAELIDSVKKDSNIDPNKYISVKSVDLDTQLPDIVLHDDNTTENDQRMFITEAFEDDDVVADFTKEKTDIIDRDTPKDIDLTLPGWGNWAGQSIEPSKRKRKRFIVKTTKDQPRRDENKGDLIINEQKDKKIKQHQVSDLPFPFKSVKDFEASIRAPIGDTFVPQTAFRRLIKPALKTKKGAVIEPMSEDVLLKQKFTLNGFLVKR